MFTSAEQTSCYLPCAMLVLKSLSSILILCIIHGSFSKPTEYDASEGRGIGSTIWEWITYPFSWWSSGPTETLPIQDQLSASSTHGPYDNIEIAKHNVTVWCSDHTCTTMKCDKTACTNTTCNIYDTNVNGQCREYNTDMKPEEPITPKPTKPNPEPSNQAIPIVTEAAIQVPSHADTTTSPHEGPAVEHPLELEAALSSTVTEGSVEVPAGDKVDKSSPQNKI